MSIAEKLIRAKADYDEVYEAGKQAEYNALWDTFQECGKRTWYQYGFVGSGWDFTNFYPKYDLKPEQAERMFYGWDGDTQTGSIKQRLEECGVILDTSKCVNLTNIFSYCRTITEVPVIDMTAAATNSSAMFRDCYILVTIEKLIVASGNNYNSTMFQSCRSLQNLVIEGTIGQNGFDVHWSTQLSHDSLMSIINALKSGVSGLTVTLGSANLAKLTDAEKAIATEKGWTLL